MKVLSFVSGFQTRTWYGSLTCIFSQEVKVLTTCSTPVTGNALGGPLPSRSKTVSPGLILCAAVEDDILVLKMSAFKQTRSVPRVSRSAVARLLPASTTLLESESTPRGTSSPPPPKWERLQSTRQRKTSLTQPTAQA